MQLPTVTLRHRRTGAVRMVNQTDYARDIARYRDFQIVSMQGGSAGDEDVRTAAQQSEVELVRRQNPLSPASKDAAAAQAARAIAVPVAAAEDWRRMTWFVARQHVRRLTGVLPDNKAHAEALMKAYGSGT